MKLESRSLRRGGRLIMPQVLLGGLLAKLRGYRAQSALQHLETGESLRSSSLLELLLRWYHGISPLRKLDFPFRGSLTNYCRMVLRKASAAFAAGCTIVCKPSPESPLSVLALAHLAEKAGFPKGVFNVLTTDLDTTPGLSEALCKHPDIKKVTFTGSVCLSR